MNVRRYELVMGIIPNTRGVAYVVFEAPLAPIAWAVIEVRGKARNRQCVQRIAQLIGQYQPAALVLQDTSPSGTKRATRIQQLNEAIAAFAETQAIEVATYSREQMRTAFGGDMATKQRIAEAIAKQIPMFERLVPPPRKPWTNEHPRMGLFDAAALVLTFYRSKSA